MRGKYHSCYLESTNIVVLEPDVAKSFKNAEAVSSALCALLRVARGLTPEPNTNAYKTDARRLARAIAATLAAMDETSGIPIVFALVSDPVGSAFVASMARPGGNITGVSVTSAALEGKRLELLKDAFPALTRVAVLYEANRVSETELAEFKRAAQTLALTIRPVGISGPADLAEAFATMNEERAGALLVPLTPLTFSHRRQIMQLAAAHRLPAIYELSEFVEEGGLMSYGPDFSDQFARAAVYVARILKGAKPGELPVEQPTRFELMINLKTAKAIGVKIPQSVLFRADKVIE